MEKAIQGTGRDSGNMMVSADVMKALEAKTAPVSKQALFFRFFERA